VRPSLRPFATPLVGVVAALLRYGVISAEAREPLGQAQWRKVSIQAARGMNDRIATNSTFPMREWPVWLMTDQLEKYLPVANRPARDETRRPGSSRQLAPNHRVTKLPGLGTRCAIGSHPMISRVS